MPLIAPFTGLRPVPERAAELIAPPYDVMDAAEARALVVGRPWSFLRLSRPEVDFPPDQCPDDPVCFAQAATTLARLQAAGLLRRDARPCYYCYRLIRGAQVQTGLVLAASLAAYRKGRIRRHEVTLTAKEEDRVRQIAALNAQTGPALLIHRRAPEIDDTLAAITQGQPAVDVLAADGVRHTLWPIVDQPLIDRLTAGFETQERLYIADGHHRTAAAERIGTARQAANPDHTGAEDYNRFLAVSFPADVLQVLSVNRLVRDLNGLDAADFLRRVAERCTVTASPVPVLPDRPGEFGLYLDETGDHVGNRAWYRLTLDPRRIPTADPVARLDVRLLQDHLLAPILGIGDPRHDPRIDFVGGIRGLEGLMQPVDSGAMRLAFSLYPTALSDLFAVADLGETMPPKCTWFETKLADGMVSLVLD
ncbi:DUF1015 domain-containing protein [uncultured Lamprocystis sp.]|jgi:uncharacterized protein (DUF1015 family)|uniref:DUF1015 domain-containing protein n=1 Tax=uncultured Lamprocystis sp. TaxID=543132 RepID=UPI0025D17981|nr:DUF1015 domain-containing protein [uncultured Lamprocystis sp.]